MPDGVVAGALRASAAQTAAAPFPAAALVAAARDLRGHWRFAAADGALYAAESFTGSLRRLTALDVGLQPAAAQSFSIGTLVITDIDGAAWIVDGSSPRRLPFDRARRVVADDATVLVIAEPGPLHASRDGGRSFTALALPAGAALDLGLDAEGPFVRGTDGDFRLRDGALIAATNLPPTPPAPPAPLHRSALPPRAEAVAALADGTHIRLEGLDVVFLDDAWRETGRRVPAPGADCALAAGADGARAVCVHEGWARAVFALPRGAATWTIVRDEARAEPMGPARFDLRSSAFAVHAPCRQRPALDPRAVCVIDAAGASHEHALPFAPSLRAVHDGVTLVVDASPPPEGPARAALLRGATRTDLLLPFNAASAATATLTDDGIALWDRDDATLRALVTAPVAAPRWTRLTAPTGTRHGIISPRATLAFGDDAATLSLLHDHRFNSPAPWIDGDPRAVPLDARGGYCVGAWCRLGATATCGLSTEVPARSIIARATPLPPRPQPAPPAPRVLRCTDDGAPSPAPDMDRGIALSGYALRLSRDGDRAALTWYGATLRGTTSVRWPGPPDDLLSARAPLLAAAPAALLSRCAAGACAHAFVAPGGALVTDLPRAPAASVHALDAGYIVRADEGSVTRVVVLDARGVVNARGTFARNTPDAWVGSLDGVAGLWVPIDGTRLRFYAPDGSSRGEVTERPGACASPTPSRGTILRTAPVTDVRGDGWRVERDEWLIEERLAVRGDVACVEVITGGEPRDEAEAERSGARGREGREVRTLVLRATGDGAFAGTAWGGHAAQRIRCTP